MRKQFKVKKRSCAMCKPHKMGWQKRWKAKEIGRMKAAEQAMSGFVNG